MLTKDNLFWNKKPNFHKLTEYGFTERDGKYFFSSDIVAFAFRIDISVSENGVTDFTVIDKATLEEYTLVKSPSAVGKFVGLVRDECEELLTDIVEKCYEANIFKSEYAQSVIRYIWEKYGAKAEYLWAKFPNNAIFREAATQKWYAALLTVEKRKLGLDEEGIIEIIDLKEKPENIEMLVDGKKYLVGYHMNKKHWYTICLDGSVPIEEIYERIDISFGTVKKR